MCAAITQTPGPRSAVPKRLSTWYCAMRALRITRDGSFCFPRGASVPGYPGCVHRQVAVASVGVLARDVPDQLPVGLTGCQHRQLREDHHSPGCGVPGQAVSDLGPEPLQARRPGRIRRANNGRHPLAPVVIGGPHDDRVADGRATANDLLDLDGHHLLATRIDHVICPAAHCQTAFSVEAAQILRYEPPALEPRPGAT